MKRKEFKNPMKKMMALFLAVIMVAGGLYLVAPEASEVKAEDTSYTATEVNDYFESKTAPKKVEGKLFAGWFEDAEYTKPVTRKITSYIDGTKYYAKYVDEDLLTVKLQIAKAKATEEDGADTYSLRVISAVDSLNYKQVGFYVYYDGAYVTKTDYTTVVSRIHAKNITEVYKFSPKVIDTQAEYFFTGTMMGINLNNYNKDFTITPYWITYGDVEVTGQSRMFSVEDGFDVKDTYANTITNLGNVNVAIPADYAEGNEPAVNADVNVKVAGTNYTAKVVGYTQDGYLHVNIPVNRTELDSNTTIQLEETIIPYQNLMSQSATDTSWYDANATEYRLATVADYKGFASLVTGGTTFENKTVYLINDLKFQDGNASAWYAGTATGTKISMVGSSTAVFSGIFDGQEHTISGFYNSTTRYLAMFPQVSGGTIKNFKVTNSCVVATGTQDTNYNASIVGKLIGGTIENVYADDSVYVKSNGKNTGGICGHSTGTSFINKCGFTGTVYGNKSNTGGIVGLTEGTFKIDNVLFAGTVGSVANYVGGIGGMLKGSNEIKNSFVNGVVESKNTSGTSITNNAGIGTLVGRLEASTTLTLEDVYIDQQKDNTVHTTYTAYKGYGDYLVAGLDRIGGSGDTLAVTNGLPVLVQETDSNSDNYALSINAFNAMNLDFWSSNNKDGAWVATQDGYPELKAFSNSTVEGKLSSEPQYGWYNAQVYQNGVKQTVNSAETNYTFELETIADMYGFAELVDTDQFVGDTVLLTNDIDFNPGWKASETAPTGGLTWTGIGSSGTFKGTFNGNEHTIKGIYMNVATRRAGLFNGTLDGATIQNFRIENSYFENTFAMVANTRFGAVAGQLNRGTIDSVYLDNSVTVTTNGRDLGGIVGYAVGDATSPYTISNCYSEANVISTSSASGANAGGIAGRTQVGTIENCMYATGEVTGNGYAGCLVGLAEGNTTIQNSVVAGGTAESSTGGYLSATVVGRVQDSKMITVNSVFLDADTSDSIDGKTSCDDDSISYIGIGHLGGTVDAGTLATVSGTATIIDSDTDFTTLTTDNVWSILKNIDGTIKYPVLTWVIE